MIVICLLVFSGAPPALKHACKDEAEPEAPACLTPTAQADSAFDGGLVNPVWTTTLMSLLVKALRAG